MFIHLLIATFITFFITSLGSSLVFLFKKTNDNILDIMLSISSGIMLSASFFSLLKPAIEDQNGSIIAISIGFALGVAILLLVNVFSKNNNRSFMLILSITLHNIPEGLAIGVAFGSILFGTNSLLSSYLLAIGIGIQNFPEGTSVSLPLRREGYSKFKAFLYGTLSGIVEPIAGIIGFFLVTLVKQILPFSLAFAAGAMILVATSELIPEAFKNDNKNLISISLIVGFLIMMILDVTLG